MLTTRFTLVVITTLSVIALVLAEGESDAVELLALKEAELWDHPIIRHIRSRRRREGCQAPDRGFGQATTCDQQRTRCEARCTHGYRFATGESERTIKCHDGVWKYGNTVWKTIRNCLPICQPECKNNGECIAPDKCRCKDDYSGQRCETRIVTCRSLPVIRKAWLPLCDDDYRFCNVTCKANHEFPDGSKIATLKCKNGTFVSINSDLEPYPSCLAVCSPPCQNKGVCDLSTGCQCSEKFLGPQCQYSIDVCDIEKTGFNGGYHCFGDGSSNVCSLHCPPEIKFNSSPAPEPYTCLYGEGTFKPQPIPQCMFEDDFWNHVTTRELNCGANNFENYKAVTPIPGHITEVDDRKYSSCSTRLYSRLQPLLCFTWEGVNYKTFDGEIFSFDSECSHILVENDNFTITTKNSPECQTGGKCFRIVDIIIHHNEYDEKYILTLNGDGNPECKTDDKILPVPVQLKNLRVEMSAHFMVVKMDSAGVKLKWDGASLVQIQASESLWNRVEGLCANMNGKIDDDLSNKDGTKSENIASLASSWQVPGSNENCDSYPVTSCDDQNMADEAYAFCSKLLLDHRFKNCSNVINVNKLQSICQSDYCDCKAIDKRNCACTTMSVYVRECTFKGVVKKMEWRDQETCPMQCTNGQVYKLCGPKTQPTCDSVEVTFVGDEDCEEGCFCPEGSVLNGEQCISREHCPCKLRKNVHTSGSTVTQGCNTCTCSYGKWDCTQNNCKARCTAYGDPHYRTFDGKRYDFMGKCSYYLVKQDDYSISAENVAYPASTSSPSVIKTVTIRADDVTIILKNDQQLSINDKEVTQFPVRSRGIEILRPSNLFTMVKLPNGIHVWWSGLSTIHVDASAEYNGKTKGLCGTFTQNEEDDFETPDGDIEQAILSFADKWKTSESCENTVEEDSNDNCDETIADKYCSKLFSEIFSDCHQFVDPDPFYNDCMYDMCAGGNISLNLCPILAGYAQDCAQHGVRRLLWRQKIDECKIDCPSGQTYQICGNSCTRSCADISFSPKCNPDCVEGCNCPQNQTLDNNDKCVPIKQCPCQYLGSSFNPGDRQIRSVNKSKELCTCAGGVWNCGTATPDEIRDIPSAADLVSFCNASDGEEFSDCIPDKKRNCLNMRTTVTKAPVICKSGCVCKKDYVINPKSGKCINETECPCYHGEFEYKGGTSRRQGCNTCHCSSGRWNCTKMICEGLCSAWGESHYTTFDRKLYEFKGQCDYILAKGSLGPEESFDISIQNVACENSDQICSKSITVIVGTGNNQDVVTLAQNKKLQPNDFKNVVHRETDVFLFLDVPDLGLVVQWDRGTRVYIRLNSRWIGRTRGLCGNYNNVARDDFLTPYGGIPEASANIFGATWKTEISCEEPKEIEPCDADKKRRIWKGCKVLKSQKFRACHSVVAVEPFLTRCISDSCGCNEAEDCEPSCTALAAYAHECNSQGVPINWRSEELCPMLCDKLFSTYSPCIPTCPRETCDNTDTLSNSLILCGNDTCVEGCLPKPCPDGEIYQSATYRHCIPKKSCETLCMTINKVNYYEGEEITKDACHSCYCSLKKKVCLGQPCPANPEDELPVFHELISAGSCKDGEVWSECAVKCSRVCHYHKYSLALSGACDKDCVPGCVPTDRVECLFPKLWRDSRTCVSIDDCTCKRHNGEAIKPGVVVQESDCESCQCLKNVYNCDRSSCNSTTTTSTGANVIPESQVYCANSTPTYLISEQGTLSDGAFDASSYLSDLFKPSNAWLKNAVPPDTGDYWKPKKMDRNQWISVNLGSLKAIHGIRLHGSTSLKEYVNTYNVYYSPDGSDALKPVTGSDPDVPTIFYGSRDDSMKTALFDDPFLAQIIRIVPQTWYNGIAIKFDIIGCSNYMSVEYGSKIDSSGISRFYSTPIDEYTLIITKKPQMLDKCDEDNYNKLNEGSNPVDRTLYASSNLKSGYGGLLATYGDKGTTEFTGGWTPKYTDKEQWFGITLPDPEPIYGLIISRNPRKDKYITSYKVLWSEDNVQFSYILDEEGNHRVFRGPVDSVIPAVLQIFYYPIEAKVIRINPQTWHEGIHIMDVELIGCGNDAKYLHEQSADAPQHVLKPVKPVCDDPLGLDDSTMSDRQVTASSTYDKLLPNLRLSSDDIWRPKLDNAEQYVEFDFYEPRNLTGVETKGHDNIWTTTYKVSYSHDGNLWNPVTIMDGTDREFLANFDDKTSQTNFFDLPIQARYLRVQPTSWHEHVGLKVEIHGCYLPYPVVEQVPTISKNVTLSKCNICEGIPVASEDDCNCKNSSDWWNGTSCVAKRECECILGTQRYPVGTIYKIKCKNCTCMLGGSSSCQPVICSPCENPKLQRRLTPTCLCHCKDCDKGKRICPTSNECINETWWCDGKEDCSDDEKNCPATEVSTTPLPTTVVTTPTNSNINKEAVCNIIGRSFNTFDNLEYKYDICNHVLARDMRKNEWQITLEQQFDKYDNYSGKVLRITHDHGQIRFTYPDMQIMINNHTFSLDQVQRLWDNENEFQITRVGDALYFASDRYNLWVTWDIDANTKIGVTTELFGNVNGLCGYFDGSAANDKQLPDGQYARKTIDFGNGWAVNDSRKCGPLICPQDIQQEVLKICSSVKQNSLSVCNVPDFDTFVSSCLETMYSCIRSNSSIDECRCRQLTAFASNCQAADSNIDLSTWRVVEDCPISCPAPLIHRDCFRNKCELSCDNLQEADPCPVIQGDCFSGCFCPDGLVRRGNECILPTQCRNCLCNGISNSKYVSFDGQNFTFNGNCTYILSKHITKDIEGGNNQHNHYQVLVTNGACPHGICTEAITVLYQKHSVQIKQGTRLKNLIVFVDRKLISSFPYKADWLTLKKTPGRDITLLIPAIQLEVASFQHNFAFMVRLPSHTFGGVMEGLCGDCNGDLANDLRKSDGQLANDANDFGNSWLATDVPSKLNISNEKCTTDPEKECVPSTSDKDPCDRLLDEERFGQCYLLVDPEPYLANCYQSLCHGTDVCDDLEAYARSCLQAGHCPAWRTEDVCPYKCPPHLEYRHCGPGCQETCSDVEGAEKVKCHLDSTEGCFCPEDEFLINGTCISKKECLVCDKDGHIDGDVWLPDKCTTCSCVKKIITCQQIVCPTTTCCNGSIAILDPRTKDECCPEYTCVPTATGAPQCVDHQKPICPDGHDTSKEDESLEPGMVRVTNTPSGSSTLVCKTETCPKPPKCSGSIIAKAIPVPGRCCARYECGTEFVSFRI